MKGVSPPPIDPLIRQRTLELAEKVGPNEAARQTGVAVGTIKSWRARERSPEALTVPEANNEGFLKAAEESYTVAVQAIRATERAIKNGKPAGSVKALSEASNKALDMTAKLLAAHERAEAKKVEIAASEARVMTDAVELALNAVGIPADFVTPVIASALRGSVDDSRAETAKHKLREFFGYELSREGWRAPQEPSQEPSQEPELVEIEDPETELVTTAEVIVTDDDEGASPRPRKVAEPDPWDTLTENEQRIWLASYRTIERAAREARRAAQRNGGRVPPLGGRTTMGVMTF